MLIIATDYCCLLCARHHAKYLKYILFFGHSSWHIGVLLPQGIELAPLVVERWSLNHLTRKIPGCYFLSFLLIQPCMIRMR